MELGEQQMIQELLAMEFPIDTIHKALASGCVDVPGAVDWIVTANEPSTSLLLPAVASSSTNAAAIPPQERLVESKRKSDLRGMLLSL